MQGEVTGKASPLPLAHQVREMLPPFVKQGCVGTISPKKDAGVRGNLAAIA